MSHDLTTTAGKIADFRDRQARAEQPSGPEAIAKQHARGKNTARERIDLLLDAGSFVEFDALAVHRSTAFGMEKKKPLGDGLVSGYGTVDGRPVAVYSQDFSVYGGSLSQVNGEKIVKVQEFALRNGCPVVGILDGGGARIQEGVASLAMFADIFRNNVHASGVVPQISLIMGPSAGGAAYSPALTDYVVMVDKTSHMFITGPDVIKTVTGEDVDMETLGGARQHNANTGTSTYLASDEADAVEFVRELLDFLPSNNLAEAPVLEHQQELEVDDDDLALDALIPDSANQPYDMRKVIEQIVDDAHFLEMQSLYAPNVIIGYGRVEGHTVGIVANQPMQFAGTLDIAASEKAARFVRHCDAFNIPIITLVDVPGLPAGQGPGVPGHHPPRRQAALRLRRGHRAQADRDHPQGLRRGLHRDGLQEARRGPQPRLAHRPDRRHGRPGCREHPVPPRARRGGGGRRRRRGQARRGHPPVRGRAAQPLPGRPARLRGRGHRTVRDPDADHQGPARPPGQAGQPCPPRSTGTSRCDAPWPNPTNLPTR